MRRTISLLAFLLCVSGHATDAAPAGYPPYNEAYDLKTPRSNATAGGASTDAALEALIAGAAAAVPAGVVVPTDAELGTVVGGAAAEAKAAYAAENTTAAGKLGIESWADFLKRHIVAALIAALIAVLIAALIAIAAGAIVVATLEEIGIKLSASVGKVVLTGIGTLVLALIEKLEIVMGISTEAAALIVTIAGITTLIIGAVALL